MDTSTLIEWILIVLVFAMYFGIPQIVKRIDNPESRVKTIKVLNISYLIATLALVCYIVYEFVAYEMESNYKLSRIAMIVVSLLMYYYTAFVKKKQWID